MICKPAKCGSSIRSTFFRPIAFALGVIGSATLLYSDDGDAFLYAVKLNSGLLIACLGIFCLGIDKLINFVDRPKNITRQTDILLLLWLGYLMTSALLMDRSVVSSKFLAFYLGCSVYMLVRSARKRDQQRDWLVYGLAILNLLETMYGSLQYFGILNSLNPYFAISGTFKNPAPYAIFLAMTLPAPLVIWHSASIKAWKFIAIVTIASCLTMLVLSNCRTAWLAATMGILVVWMGHHEPFVKRLYDTGRKNLKKVLAWILLFLMILTISVLGLYAYKKPSSDTRLFVWDITLNKIAEKPIIGYGYGSFKGLYNKWQIQYFSNDAKALNKTYFNGEPIAKIAGYIRMAYNDYIELTAEQGLAGLLIFISLIATALWKGARSVLTNRSNDVLFAVAGLIAFLTAAFFSYPLYSLPTQLLLFIFLASVANAAPDRQRQRRVPNLYQVTIAFCLIVTGIVAGNLTLNRIGAYQDYESAKGLVARNLTISAEKKYDVAHQYLKDEPQFLFDHGYCLLANGDPLNAYHHLQLTEELDNSPNIYILKGHILKGWKRYDEAELNYLKALYVIPSAIYPKYLLVKLYQEVNKKDQAIALAKQVVRSSPKINNDVTKNIIKELVRFINGDSDLVSRW